MNHTDDKQRDAVSDTPRTNLIMDNIAVAISADTREQSIAHREEAHREIEQLELELAAVTADRDALKSVVEKVTELMGGLITHLKAMKGEQ